MSNPVAPRALNLIMEPAQSGAWRVTCPALPEIALLASDKHGALVGGKRAVAEALQRRILAGAHLVAAEAEPATNYTTVTVQLDAATSLKLELYGAMRAAGVTRAELGRRLGWNRTSVDRLFDLGHASRLDQLEAAATAIGRSLQVSLVACG